MKKLIFLVTALVLTAGCSIDFLGGCPENQTSFEDSCCDDYNGDGLCDAFEGSCDDGIRNRDETQMDCGGDSCTPCEDIACRQAMDCGINSAGPPYCIKEKISRDVLEFECMNPGKDNSFCSNKTYTKTINACNEKETCLDSSPTCMTPDLITAACHNTKRDMWEENIDCGGPCRPCHNCANKIKDGLEDGLDCGGPSCSPCPSCQDGFINGNEEGIDCGGPECKPCPTCTDRIMNGRELGMDCGGPCEPCYPTCFNHFKDANEEKIDCGGPCKPCPNCNDGIKNGLEWGIDCGGDCPSCPYECYEDQDCGFDHKAVDSCINNSIYNNFISYACENPGIPEANCVTNKSSEFAKSCADKFETCLVTDYCSEMGDCRRELVEARCILNSRVCLWIWCEEGESYSIKREEYRDIQSPTTLLDLRFDHISSTPK
ncbi:MAG: hypothetical protein ABH950_10035 [Candidatus Altiarchaeota archaeon]